MTTERKILIGLIVIASLILGYLWYKGSVNPAPPWTPDPTPQPQPQPTNQLEALFAQAKQTNKNIVLFFTNFGCVPCEQMKRDVFPKADVQRALSNYLFAEIDTTKDPATGQAFQVTTLPTLIMVTGNKQIVKIQQGVISESQLLWWLGAQPPQPTPPRRNVFPDRRRAAPPVQPNPGGG